MTHPRGDHADAKYPDLDEVKMFERLKTSDGVKHSCNNNTVFMKSNLNVRHPFIEMKKWNDEVGLRIARLHQQLQRFGSKKTMNILAIESRGPAF